MYIETNKKSMKRIIIIGSLVSCALLALTGEVQDDSLANYAHKLNKDEALNSMPSIRNSEVGGVKKIPTISEPLLAVSASNLKSALIDPGYISLADAGL